MDGEGESENELLSVLDELNKAPFNYDCHTRYISLLKALGPAMADELRQARQSMHSIFPLSEDLWLEWLQAEIDSFDELRPGTDSESVQTLGRAILELFELAVQDYLSIPIWKRYLEFVSESVFPAVDEDETDKTASEGWLTEEEARSIFQSALQATGLHFQKSHILWNMYRDFEVTALERCPKGSEVHNKHIETVRALYLARLQVPHSEIAQTFNDYSPFETRYDNANYEARLKNASSIRSKTDRECAKREATERRLQSAGNSAHAFLEQIEFFGKQKGDAFHVRTLYERAIAIHFLDASVWESYIVFLMTKMRVQSIIMSVLDRAVRNCNWSGELWGHRLRIGEIFGESEEESTAIFGRACSFITELKSADQFVVLMRNWTGFSRRKVHDSSASSGPIAEGLRMAHKIGIQVFREAFGNNGDFRLEEAYIHDEINLFNNVAKARAIYDTLLLSNPNSIPLHILISGFERHHGRDLGRAHWILQQALGKPGMKNDTRETLLKAIVDLERDCGYSGIDGKDSFYEVLAKAKHAEWMCIVQRVKQAEKQGWAGYTEVAATAPVVEAATEYEMPSNNKRPVEVPEEVQHVSKKAKSSGDDHHQPDMMQVDEQNHSEKPAEKKEFYVMDDSNAGNIIRLVGIKPETDPSFFKTLFSTKTPPIDYYIKPNEDGSTDGFIEFARTDDAVQAALKHTAKVYGESVPIQRCIPSKKWTDFDETPAETPEKTKIYVSNLDCGVTKPLLREAFGKFGKIKEIRLVMRQSIAFAYIEFESGRSAEKSLELNNRTLEGFPGRKMTVAISDKTKTKKRVADPKELIVTNFTIGTTKDDLMKLFDKYGIVKDIRILKDQTGVSRGVGFVEYEDEASAKQALALNGTELDGKFIAVAPSDPNVRGGVHAKEQQNAKGSSHGGAGNARARPGLGHPSRGGGGGRGGGPDRDSSRSGAAGSAASAPEVKPVTAFVPRNASKLKAPAQRLAVNSVAAAPVKPAGVSGPVKGSSEGGKSNDDFRKMLTKKSE
ncbi:Splicing factor [Chytriomyces hyalinus]|nr:Splicing factor [Chytriomyces hyalinus]